MEITKVLTNNDLGLTGAHQSGVVIPHKIARLGFFPNLNDALVNPRVKLIVEVASSGEELDLNYIYYNGRIHGTSTRNEYRLTGISGFLRNSGASIGDELTFTKNFSGQIAIRLSDRQPQDNLQQDHIKISINSWTLKGV